MKALIRATFLLFSVLFAGVSVAQHEGHVHAAGDTTHSHEAVITTADVHAEHATEATAEAHDEHGVEKFNPGEMIMGHVGDEHGWHLWGHTSLPLPILIYNTERGFSSFSSAQFDHGHKTFGGYMLHEGKIVATDAADGTDAHQAAQNEELTAATWDISITKNVLGLMVSVLIMLLVFLSVAKGYEKRGVGAPKGPRRASSSRSSCSCATTWPRRTSARSTSASCPTCSRCSSSS